MNFDTSTDFEEVFDALTNKCIGTRQVNQDPKRPYGYAGRREFIITEPITLRRGHKDVVFKASKEKPLKLYSYQHMLCGKALYDPTKGYKRE